MNIQYKTDKLHGLINSKTFYDSDDDIQNNELYIFLTELMKEIKKEVFDEIPNLDKFKTEFICYTSEAFEKFKKRHLSPSNEGALN